MVILPQLHSHARVLSIRVSVQASVPWRVPIFLTALERAHPERTSHHCSLRTGGFEKLAQEAERRPSLETNQPCELLPMTSYFFL